MSIISVVTVSLPNTDVFIRYGCGGLPELEGTTGLPGRLVLVVVLWRWRSLVVVGRRIGACIVTPVVVGRRRLVVVVVRTVIKLTTKWLGRRGRNISRRDGYVMESTWSWLGRRWGVH